MLIEELNKKRIPESHNKIKKSGATFGYNLHCCAELNFASKCIYWRVLTT
jgi:hypothetical protein